jgi:hypothetical protein
MKRKFFLAVSVLALWSGNVFAASGPTLKGEFGVTGTDLCLISSLGFNPSLQPVSGSSVSTLNSVAEGIVTFNGTGKGTVSLTTGSISPPPTPGATVPSASSSDSTHSITYTTNTDDSFTYSEVAGSYAGTILTGPREGQTFTVANLPVTTGLISSTGANLTSASLAPTVETITYSNGDILQRICQRQRVFILLKPKSALP